MLRWATMAISPSTTWSSPSITDTERCWILASGLPERASGTREARARLRLDWMAALLDRPALPGPSDSAHVVWSQTITRDVYRRQVERVQDYIRAGDIYQANIAQRFVSSLPDGSRPFDLYRSLRAANPAPFAAYLDQGARHVLSTIARAFPARAGWPCGDAADQGHGAAGGRSRPRSSGAIRAACVREGPRRERDDRRSAAQRPVARL